MRSHDGEALPRPLGRLEPPPAEGGVGSLDEHLADVAAPRIGLGGVASKVHRVVDATGGQVRPHQVDAHRDVDVEVGDTEGHCGLQPADSATHVAGDQQVAGVTA